MLRSKLIPMTILDYIEEPLEKTRLFGPFNLDTALWIGWLKAESPSLIKVGHDADGREYAEF